MSEGTTYQGTSVVLVAPLTHSSYAVILLPGLPLLDVRPAEFPVLFRLIGAVEEALTLLALREVQVELHDVGAVAIEDRGAPPRPK
jgi:hypothetical protein